MESNKQAKRQTGSGHTSMISENAILYDLLKILSIHTQQKKKHNKLNFRNLLLLLFFFAQFMNIFLFPENQEQIEFTQELFHPDGKYHISVVGNRTSLESLPIEYKNTAYDNFHDGVIDLRIQFNLFAIHVYA